MTIDLTFPLEAEITKKTCQGNIFKACVGIYRTKKGFGQTIRFTRSARLSCPGCDYCGWQFDSLDEINKDYPIHDLEKAEDGNFYGLSICNPSYDWETGILDNYDLILIPFSNKEQ